MNSKSLFASKTVWINTLSAVLIPVLSANGISLSADEIGLLFAAGNVALRLISSAPVHLIKKS